MNKKKNNFKLIFFVVLFFIFLIIIFLLKTSKKEQSITYNHRGYDIEIIFRGELSSDSVFGRNLKLTDTVYPRNNDGQLAGEYFDYDTIWLDFSYKINGKEKNILVAKKPIMNYVSWQDIARAGAVLGDDSEVIINGETYFQDAIVVGRYGKQYRVKLLRCGQGVSDHLSEWNMLIGSIHQGDIDFTSDYFGWIESPYTDQDLYLGHNGSLNWCQEEWLEETNYRVTRGYFYASRWHAAPENIASDRIFWRPVLESINSDDFIIPKLEIEEKTEFNQKGQFYGEIKHDNLFDNKTTLADLIDLNSGRYIQEGRPDWLYFQTNGKELLVAKKPIKYALSWQDIAKVGAVSGDNQEIIIDNKTYIQDAIVTDKKNKQYKVRLLYCGQSTLDNFSEWNMLIGGTHQGDYDFKTIPKLNNYLYSNDDIFVGLIDYFPESMANWCKETKIINSVLHAVNRGFLTVSRFHLTDISFAGTFAWRPVLELIK